MTQKGELYEKAYKKFVLLGLVLVLAAAWRLWYARPVDVRFLSGGETPDSLSVIILDVTTHESTQLSLDSASMSLSAENPEMDAVWQQLDSLRFHRNPLEILLRFLPAGSRTITGYSYDLYGYDQEGAVTLSLHFDGNSWSQGNRPLPLYTSRQVQEAGQTLGELLWEITGNIDSKS